MRKAFRKAFSNNHISDPAILERAAKSECRAVFAPESRCWDTRSRSGSVSPQVAVPSLDIFSHTSEADLTPARQEVPADPSPPLSLPLPSPPRALSPVPGPSGLQNPPRREPSPESRRSGIHSRPVSPSSSDSASPSPPSKKMKKSRDSSDKCEILPAMARMSQDFVASPGSVQSRLTTLESPARIVQPVEREEVTDEEDGSGHSGSDRGSSGDEAENPEPHPMDYDPHRPSLGLCSTYEAPFTSSLTPSLSSDSQQEPEDSQKEFFFFPEETGFTDDGIQYRGYFISFDSGEVECSKIQGQEAFAPLIITPAVRFLLDQSEWVQSAPEASSSTRQNFKSLTKACNTYAYRSLNFVPDPATSHSISIGKALTFLATISTLEPITPPPF